MYPTRFRYEAPRSIEDAIALLRDGAGEAKVLAGGQSLVPLLKLRFAAPEVLVDINNLPGLSYHKVDPDGTIRVGALCRHAELERSAVLAAKQPTMAAAAMVGCLAARIAERSRSACRHSAPTRTVPSGSTRW